MAFCSSGAFAGLLVFSSRRSRTNRTTDYSWQNDFRSAVIGQDLYKFLFADHTGMTDYKGE
jgi:hypothetical protein